MDRNQIIVAGCLVGVAISLLLVGIVSATFVRHVLQILPIVGALALVLRWPAWGSYAALPVFGFWLVIVALIWLYLLGISAIASGRYTAIEIALTVVIAVLSMVGVARSRDLGGGLTLAARTSAFVVLGFFQVAAMWISLLPPFANR